MQSHNWVAPAYIDECVQAGKFVEPETFLWGIHGYIGRENSEIDISTAYQRVYNAEGLPFRDMNVVIGKDVQSPRVIQRLISIGGGLVATTPDIATHYIGIQIPNADDMQKLKTLKVICVKSDFIKAIIFGKLAPQVDDFKLT